jgi:hypothetical protein
VYELYLILFMDVQFTVHHSGKQMFLPCFRVWHRLGIRAPVKSANLHKYLLLIAGIAVAIIIAFTSFYSADVPPEAGSTSHYGNK